MAQPKERYEYSALQGHSSIRLLTILPGSFDTPLSCHLNEYQNCHDTPYDALSYAWGESVPQQSISICGPADSEQSTQYISITQNLSEALLHLRAESAPRKLWVDALCINQEDLEEKSLQVAHMGQVYRKADQVIVWLGESKKYPRTEALLTQDGRNRWPLTRPETDLGELLAIPWFSRAWAVQEYLLPKQVSFQLGTLSIQAQHLENIVTLTGAYLESNEKLYDEWKSILLLFEYRKTVQEQKPSDKNPRFMLIRIFLDLTRKRLCRDSRDRIYGILGISNNINIVPDYTVPPRQVYTEFVSRHLVAGDFSVLHECCIGIPNMDEQSYVPFFGQSQLQSTYVPFADPLGSTYYTGMHLPPAVTIHDNKHISIKGFCIDTVEQKLDFVESSPLDIDSVRPSDETSKANVEAGKLPLQGTWGAIYQIILMHLIKDPAEQVSWKRDFVENRLSPHFSREPYPFNSLFDVLVRIIRTDLNPDFDWLSSKGTIRPDSHLRRQRRKILQDRSLFWTRAGFVGLGTAHLQPGDEVVVFNGDMTPFLLRKEVQEGNSEGVYKIVSDCYLYGWMYGLYPDTAVASNSSRRAAITSKVKRLRKTGVEQKTGPIVMPRTFVIS